jgi:hypothetical protein
MTLARTPRIIAFAAYVFMVVMNTLATTLPLNNQTTAEISDRYDTLFAPIGFTFAIWGVIYLLLGVYSVYQLVRPSPVIQAITPWFIASSVLNGVWIVAWHYEVIWLSLVLIVGLLATLIVITKTTTKDRTPLANTVAVRLPFSVYFGWVTVATVANASALLVQAGWRGGGVLTEEGWLILILVVAAAIGTTTTLVRSSFGYGLVLVWAFWGILSRHLSPTGWDEQYPNAIFTLQILLPLLAVVSVVGLVRWLRQPVISPVDTATTAVTEES